MNQDIIDWLEGYWSKRDASTDDFFFELEDGQGVLTYFPKLGILLIGSDDGYGYTVQIRDLQHLIQLEALL